MHIKGTKRVIEKNEYFNGFYSSMKPKILVPRAT